MLNRINHSAFELAFAFEPDTYTSSGNIWRIRCPSPEHGKPLEDRDIGNCVVGDGGKRGDGLWAYCHSNGDCTTKGILSALYEHKEWFNDFTRDIKSSLYSLQDGECSGCFNPFELDLLQVDHIIPKTKGGKSHPYNYTLLCENCNSVKSNTMSLEELRNKIS